MRKYEDSCECQLIMIIPELSHCQSHTISADEYEDSPVAEIVCIKPSEAAFIID